MTKFDLHIHSNCSDGSDTPEILAGKIAKSDLDIVALTDHDTTDGISEIEPLIPDSIKFIKGIELTCKIEDIKFHLLGYGYNIFDKGLEELINKGKVLRRQKLETRIEYLKSVWNITLTKEEKDWLYSRKSVVKTHMANILVNRGLAPDNLSAMAKYLDDCKTGNTRFDGVEAINVLKSAGAITVWAHPLGGEGEEHCSPEVFYKKLEKMKYYGIQGLECYYSRYSNEEIEFLVKAADDNQLFISGGSDYHGTNKDIPLGKLNIYNNPVTSDCATILSVL